MSSTITPITRDVAPSTTSSSNGTTTSDDTSSEPYETTAAPVTVTENSNATSTASPVVESNDKFAGGTFVGGIFLGIVLTALGVFVYRMYNQRRQGYLRN